MIIKQEDFDKIVAKHMDRAMEQYVVSKYSEWSGLMQEVNKKVDAINNEVALLKQATLTLEEKRLITNFATSLNGADLISKVISWLAKLIVSVGAIGAGIAYVIKHYL